MKEFGDVMRERVPRGPWREWGQEMRRWTPSTGAAGTNKGATTPTRTSDAEQAEIDAIVDRIRTDVNTPAKPKPPRKTRTSTSTPTPSTPPTNDNNNSTTDTSSSSSSSSSTKQ
jgi:hypothetical protein